MLKTVPPVNLAHRPARFRARIFQCLLAALACVVPARASRAPWQSQDGGGADTGNSPIVSSFAQDGSAAKSLGSGGVSINPGEDIQARVTAAAEGTTFVLKAGVHRLQTITPKSRQTFVGETGTILSGARVLTSFSHRGAAWVASGQTQHGTVNGTPANGICRKTSPRCGYPEDLFINDLPLQHVASLGEGGPGKWYFDYAALEIYFWDDPSGKKIETSVTAMAFGGHATDVTIRNLVVEKYAAPTQDAAVFLGTGWLLENAEVRWNHFSGVDTGLSSIARGNYVHHNGALGFQGAGSNILVENNQIAYNNYAGYDSFWGAGGGKWVYTDGLTVRGNFSHHNDGPGLWTDINNINTLYENNIVEDNARGGIFHEISYAAIIRNNTARRNGTGHDFPYWTTGAGIEIVGSPNVEIYGNTLEDNWQGITGLDDGRTDPKVENHGRWQLINLNVHNNTVIQRQALGEGSGRTGVVTSVAGTYTRAANIVYRANNYSLGPYAKYFMWDGEKNETDWKAVGQDTSGTIQR